MQGDDRVRHCDQCRLNVYNLSAMSKDEAERLISEREGRLCISYFQRPDGTILTRDCPKGLRGLAQRALGVGIWITAACVAFFSATFALASGARGSGALRLSWFGPFRQISARCYRIEEWLGLPQPWRSQWGFLPGSFHYSGVMWGDFAPPFEELSPSEQNDIRQLQHYAQIIAPELANSSDESQLSQAIEDWRIAREIEDAPNYRSVNRTGRESER